MATTSTPGPQVSVTDAARDAIEHTRQVLFPIRVERWLILGFLAFLDQCGRTLNGGGPGGGGDGAGPKWPDRRGRGAAEEIAEAFQTASAWLSEHAVEVAIEMGGGRATVSSRFALEVMDDVFGDTTSG